MVAVKRAEKAPAEGLKPDTAVLPALVTLVPVAQFRFMPGSTRVSAGSPEKLVLEKYSALTPELLMLLLPVAG
ncbi:hypothetical protein ALP75_200605 [Pseudomonas syringae pv. actinidiae]|nr:hypothetical protein ALP75_200605 [Pseudomonas syringae pv. actinidiae]